MFAHVYIRVNVITNLAHEFGNNPQITYRWPLWTGCLHWLDGSSRYQLVVMQPSFSFSFSLSLRLSVFPCLLGPRGRRARVSEFVQTHVCMQELSRNGKLCPSLEADLQSLELACCHAAKTGGSAK